MPKILAVPHFRQEADAGCLPACAQMVLAYLGFQRSQAELARLMGTHPQMGTPYSHLIQLHSDQIAVEYGKANELIDLDTWLNNDLPVIAFVQMGELPYARHHLAQHAVVVIGIDQEGVYIQDPAVSRSVVSVPHNDFLLAWEEMSLAYAVIAKR